MSPNIQSNVRLSTTIVWTTPSSHDLNKNLEAQKMIRAINSNVTFITAPEGSLNGSKYFDTLFSLENGDEVDKLTNLHPNLQRNSQGFKENEIQISNQGCFDERLFYNGLNGQNLLIRFISIIILNPFSFILYTALHKTKISDLQKIAYIYGFVRFSGKRKLFSFIFVCTPANLFCFSFIIITLY